MIICQIGKSRPKSIYPKNRWHGIIFEVPQGSIIGPLLFNIFLIDLSFIIQDIDIASCANENTSYISANNINEVIQLLGKTTNIVSKWFSDNLRKSILTNLTC